MLGVLPVSPVSFHLGHMQGLHPISLLLSGRARGAIPRPGGGQGINAALVSYSPSDPQVGIFIIKTWKMPPSMFVK